MKNVGNSSRGRSQGVPKIFRAPTYRAHCAVIFAKAQLSCNCNSPGSVAAVNFDFKDISHVKRGCPPYTALKVGLSRPWFKLYARKLTGLPM